MAEEDTTVEPEVVTEPVAESPEPVVTPEVETTDTDITDTQEETAAPEAADGGLVEAVEALEAEPDPLSFLEGMTQAEKLKWVRDQAPDLASDLEYAGAERRESALRRDSATREETQRLVAGLKKDLAEAPEGDLEKLNFVYDNAAGHSKVEIMRQIAKQAVASWAPDEAQIASLNATIEATSSEAMETYAAELVGIAAGHIGQQKAFALSIDDIPADSALAQSYAAREKVRIDAAVKAAQLQARPTREPEPVVSVGAAAGLPDGNPLLLKLERQGRAALSADELAQAATLLGVPLPD